MSEFEHVWILPRVTGILGDSSMQMKFGRAIKPLFGQISQRYSPRKQRQIIHEWHSFPSLVYTCHVIRREVRETLLIQLNKLSRGVTVVDSGKISRRTRTFNRRNLPLGEMCTLSLTNIRFIITKKKRTCVVVSPGFSTRNMGDM